MAKYVVIGSNAFSGQDFVDLILDDPRRHVIGLSRSAEKPGFMLRYRGHRNAANFRFAQLDMNTDMDALLSMLDAEKPEFIIKQAVKGMLPKNRLAAKMLTKLRVFPGATHDHDAQNPVKLK